MTEDEEYAIECLKDLQLDIINKRVTILSASVSVNGKDVTYTFNIKDK